LALDEGQADVHHQVGLLLAITGRSAAARTHLERAEALGDVDASYQLARIDVEKSRSGALGWLADLVRVRRLWDARSRVLKFLSTQTSSSSIYFDDVRALREDLDSRLVTLLVMNTAWFSALLLLCATLVSRRWGGADLRMLIAAHPEAGPEVQRLLSAIRHEVLKHNTMVLTGLVEAIARGEDVTDKATHLQRSLFGQSGEHAVFHRLRGYQDQLEKIGRAYGVRLNLTRKDAALSAIHQGFRILEKTTPALRNVHAMGASRRHRLLKQTQRATLLLNTTGYEAVRGLLDQLRVLRVDEAMLREIYLHICMEPALAHHPRTPLQLELDVQLPVGVCIPRSAFEDILHNLMRNALQSGLRTGLTELVLGLRVTTEINPITGHERVAFWVCDQSTQKLDLEVLLGQKIEGGLGLTSELVSRYDGSLAVETDVAGWQKAVVVKLPREEASAETAA